MRRSITRLFVRSKIRTGIFIRNVCFLEKWKQLLVVHELLERQVSSDVRVVEPNVRKGAQIRLRLELQDLVVLPRIHFDVLERNGVFSQECLRLAAQLAAFL